VGKYALKFKWNDGHEAGIYSWDIYAASATARRAGHARLARKQRPRGLRRDPEQF